MTIAFAEMVRSVARGAIYQGEIADDFACVLAALSEEAVIRANAKFGMKQAFLLHDPVGYRYYIQIVLAIMIGIAPDKKTALECLRNVKMSEISGKAETARMPHQFELARKYYRPSKEPLAVDEDAFARFILEVEDRAGRVVKAWMAGVDLEKLPA